MACGPLILASASPRRSSLLRQIGVAHEVRAPAIDETQRRGEAPAAYVRRLARAKAEAVQRAADGADRPVLAADTAVVLGGRVFGKPADEAEAVAMLMALSGRTHEVLTAVALIAGGRVGEAESTSRVSFRALAETECRRYWATGEPADKAGAYAIQGLGAVFVTQVEGSFSGVMGLPLCETAALLAVAGLSWWQDRPERTPCRPCPSG